MNRNGRLVLPKIYPITDREISGLTHTEQVRRLIAGGAKIIQLREKDLGSGEWLDDARAAIYVARPAGVKIVINDRADLAAVIGSDGVHLGQDDLPPHAARKVLGEKAIIGFSTHTLEQAKIAMDLPVDYLAFGPVFATGTKKDTDPVVGTDLLAEVCRLAIGLPVVAIGGITHSNLSAIFASGAASAALISEILREPDEISKNIGDLIAHAR